MAFVSTAHKLGHLFPSQNLPDHVIMYHGQWWIRLDVFCVLTGMQTNEFFHEYARLCSRAVRVLVGDSNKLRYREYNRSATSALDTYLAKRVDGEGTKASCLWIPTTNALNALIEFQATSPDLKGFVADYRQNGCAWIDIRPIHLRYVLKRAAESVEDDRKPVPILQYISDHKVRVVVHDRDWQIACANTDWESVALRVEIGTRYPITLVSAA